VNNLDFVIYLFLLKKKNNQSTFFNQLFHFHRFVSIHKRHEWEKLFVFDGFKVKDTRAELIFARLKFWLFIDDSLMLTAKGEEFLNEKLKEFPEFETSLSLFFEQYKDEPATRNSCFTDSEHVSISCSFCKEKSCLNQQSNLIHLLPLSLRKRKNPYKSVLL
jgi:hypothetical protein